MIQENLSKSKLCVPVRKNPLQKATAKVTVKGIGTLQRQQFYLAVTAQISAPMTMSKASVSSTLQC